MRRLVFCILALFVVSNAPTCFSQQTDIRQFVAFAGYSYLATPSLNLTQRGFDGDVGYNVRPWLTFGFDFGYYTGHSTLFPNELNPAALATLAALGPLPPGFGVPYNISTQTYEAGPQFNYRRLKRVTFFVRPALGALHANVAVSKTFLAASGELGPALCGLLNGCSKNDTVPFYGFGGGMTWEINPHFALRATADFAHYDFFSSLLNGGRNSVRVSVGPRFGFGKNIVQK
jgi:hypothetical protein